MMRYTQPQSGPAQIDWTNPLVKGLRALSTSTIKVDRVSGKVGTTSGAGGYTTGIGKFGVARTFSRSSAAQEAYSDSGFSGDFTLFLVGGITGATGSTQQLIGAYAGTTERFYLGENSNSNLSLLTNPKAGSPVTASVGGTGDAVYVARMAGATMSLFRNGVLVSTATQAGNDWTDVTQFVIGSTNFLANPGGNVFMGGYASRAWGDAEVVSFSNNPWQLLRAQPRPLPSTPAGGPATYTYSATGGMLIAGTTTKIRELVRTPSGGLTYLGTAPATRAVIRSPTGGYTFSGTTTTLRSRVLSAVGGIFFSGVSTVSFFAAVKSLVISGTGGVLFGGTSAKVRGVVRTLSGGALFGGSSTIAQTPDPNPPTKRNFKRGRHPRQHL